MKERTQTKLAAARQDIRERQMMTLSRRNFIYAGAGALLAAAALPARGQTPRPRLLRKDAFFGLHFDLHPQKNDTILGRDVTEEMVDRLLIKVRPDYVQYDCKGHAGYAGYPTKVGTPSPGIVRDSLAIWRRVTARHGVALLIHYSGALNALAVEQHPEWAVVGADGKRDRRGLNSAFGPYVDQLLIPQLIEVADMYDLDGAWVDGECWAMLPDYSPAAARAFSAATGFNKLPTGKDDPGWLEFLEFNREQFRQYVRRYVEALHRARPNFQIASNWLYSSFVPEKPDAPVDFLSGDYPDNASLATARLEARYLAATGQPWDLQAWGFQRSGTPGHPRHNHKSAVQLMQESSVVLAQGGGFAVYYQPSRGGYVDERHVEVMAQLAQFCRARQALSHKSETAPQIGLLFSTTSLYRTADKLFGVWRAAVNPARGLLDALVENHYSVDVIPEWRLAEVASRYPLIVIPEWPDLGAPVKEMLTQYVKRGGKIVIAGVENAALFADSLGVRLLDTPSEQSAFVPGDEVFGNVTGVWQKVEPGSARVIETRYPTYDSTRDGVCAATLSDYGAGRIAAVYGPAGSIFAAYHAPAVRQFIRRVVEQVFTPRVRLGGPPTVELALRKQGEKLLLHLVNTTAMQVAADYAVVDFIPSIGPLEVSVQLPRRPRSVRLEPEGRALAGVWKGENWRATLDKLEIHGIIAIEL